MHDSRHYLGSPCRGGLNQLISATVWNPQTPAPAAGSTLKIVHFMRHGQGWHNVAVAQSPLGCLCELDGQHRCPMADPTLVDARLTDRGRAQATQLRQQMLAARVQLVVSSPLTRCLETATLATSLVPDAVPRVVVEACRERLGTHVCNICRPASLLRQEFAHFDFSLLSSVDKDAMAHLYPDGTREPVDALARRAAALLVFLQSRPETVISVFSHSSFLACLVQSCLQENPDLPKSIRTGELFSVVLDLSSV